MYRSVFIGSPMTSFKGLYAITPTDLGDADLLYRVEQALDGGVAILQYRDKSSDQKKRLQQASQLKKLCSQYQATFIVNDDLELAQGVNADGVHLGANDGDLLQTRERLGDGFIIGASCYNRMDLAIEAEKNGADYVAFGAFFNSPTKPNAVTAPLTLLTEAKKNLSIPICAIGGITQHNITEVISHGADMAAVISDLFYADSICQRSKILREFF